MRINLAKVLLNLAVLNSATVYEYVNGIIFSEDGENIIVESGRAHEVILKCPYQLDDGDEDGLAVYWYYNDIPRPLYQWIPFRTPQAIGFLKDFIDLSYEGSDRDYYRYKDLRLVSPTTNLTGKYKCKVSAYEDEETYVVNLVIYSTPSTFEVNILRQEEGIVIVRCDAYPVYPEPRLSLFKSLHGKRILLRNGELESRWKDGTYTVSLQAEVDDAQLHGMTQFECDLNIPDTSISWKTEIKYIPRTLPNIHHMYSTVSDSGSSSKMGGWITGCFLHCIWCFVAMQFGRSWLLFLLVT